MHELRIQVGSVAYRVGSPWKAPIAAMRRLYEGYPSPEDGIATYTARIDAPRPWRRWLRPQAAIEGDYMLPGAIPMALRHGLLALEMGMNMQVALGERRHLLIHAAAVERGGRAIILPGDSGSGKSTLAALLGEHGWRLMSDEFILIDIATGEAIPFPRPISLKNSAIPVMEALIEDKARFGPLLSDTPKGELRHLRPRADAIARMHERARPALILFPRYGDAASTEGVSQSELFMRITEGSTNYIPLGQPAFERLHHMATKIPAATFSYPDTAAGIGIVEQFAAEAGF